MYVHTYIHTYIHACIHAYMYSTHIQKVEHLVLDGYSCTYLATPT